VRRHARELGFDRNSRSARGAPRPYIGRKQAVPNPMEMTMDAQLVTGEQRPRRFASDAER